MVSDSFADDNKLLSTMEDVRPLFAFLGVLLTRQAFHTVIAKYDSRDVPKDKMLESILASVCNMLLHQRAEKVPILRFLLLIIL